MSDKDAIIAKVKKCLALAKSANEHEAAAALRQAQKLMQAHNISDLDIEHADVLEGDAKAGAKSTPAAWESRLARLVAQAFGCEMFFCEGISHGRWRFVGIGPAAEIAVYAFEVMFRQAKRNRAEHILTALKRCGPVNRTRRADLYCEGWVRAARQVIGDFANSDAGAEKLLAYVRQKYRLEPFETRNRNSGRNLSNRDFGDLAAGAAAGRNARIDRGISGSPAPLAIGEGSAS